MQGRQAQRDEPLMALPKARGQLGELMHMTERGRDFAAAAMPPASISSRSCSRHPAGMGAAQLPQPVGTGLPPWRSVLAVVAHPDDESFGLGAVLTAFIDRGARVSVLCLTHGERSTVHGVDGDLYRVRTQELRRAAAALGVATTNLRHYPDGDLQSVCRTQLAGEVADAVREVHADGLLLFDSSGVTGHTDHAAATAAALVAAKSLGLPALGWTLPKAVAGRLNAEYGTAFAGHDHDQIDSVVTVDRHRQRAAIAAHASQALPTGVLWRRLEWLGSEEHLRWLTSQPADRPAHRCRRTRGTRGLRSGRF